MNTTLIFDLDGTLYPFKEDTLQSSLLYKTIIHNTEKYLMLKTGVTAPVAKATVQHILNTYGTRLSIALEEMYSFDRYEYFAHVWNIDPKLLMQQNPTLTEMMYRLYEKYTLVILSDAPRVWIDVVLRYLGIEDLFNDSTIFSGEGDIRKEHYNAFESLIEKLHLEPKNCISIGDQIHSDIIPAKALGMRTILIGNTMHTSTNNAISSIEKCEDALTQLLK